MDKSNVLHSYSAQVKVTGWQARSQAYPFDDNCAQATGRAHYLTFGATNERFIPKTTTREIQESTMVHKVVTRVIPDKAINFISYPENDFRFKEFAEKQKDPLLGPPLSTWYRDDYKVPKPMTKRIDCCIQPPDPLLNKIPKCDFEVSPASEHKFMDDHIVKVSEGRKKINFLRQIRNATNLFGA